MNSYEINKYLYSHYINFNYVLFNTYVFGWESDFLATSKTGYIHEVEIKISKTDFKHDFNKTHFNGKNKHEFLLDKNEIFKPNKFFFACPEGIIKPEQLPDEYGLFYLYKDDWQYFKLIKKAKFLHKTQLLEEKTILRKLMRKFYFRNIELKHAMKIFEYDLKYNQRRLFDYDYY